MTQENNTNNTAGSDCSGAACSPFFYGQKVTHKLNGTAGIITIKGQKYNAGQTWKVRFERADRFEEIEVWEWEISPENVKGVARRREGSQSEANERRCPPLPLPSCSPFFIPDLDDGFKRRMVMAQKNGSAYLAVDVDADLVVKLSPAKREALIALLTADTDGELNL